MNSFGDDTFAAGNDGFMTLTNKIMEEFESKSNIFPPFMFALEMIN